MLLKDRRVWAAVLLVLQVASARAAKHRTLFVGNSYTAYNAPNPLSTVVEHLIEVGVPGLPDCTSELVAPAGAVWSDHLASAQTPGTALSTALQGSWNLVVLQEQSQIPGFHAYPELFQPSVDALVGLEALIAPTGARTLLLMTWGRRTGDPQNAVFGTFTGMQKLLAEGYEKYAVAASTPDRTVAVAPAGLAWRRVWDDAVAVGDDPLHPESLFARLYQADGSHPSPAGTYLAACVVYAAATGMNPTGLGLGVWLPEAERLYLQEVARRVVLDSPWEPLVLPWGSVPRYPWLETLADHPGAVAIGALDERATRMVTSPTSVGEIVLAPSPTFGRLAVLPDGALDVDVAVEVGPHGRLDVAGGTLESPSIAVEGMMALEAGTCRVGVLEGSGTVRMTGGALTADEIHLGLSVGSGELVVPAGGTLVQGSLLLPAEGRIRLTVPGGKLQVSALALLSGPVQVDVLPDAAGEYEVLTAGAVTPDPIDVVVPAGVLVHQIPTPGGGIAIRVQVGYKGLPVKMTPPPGAYPQALDLVLTSPKGGVAIHYTTDGSIPALTSPSGPSPVVIPLTGEGATTVRAFVLDTDGLTGPPATGIYLVDATPPDLDLHPASGAYAPPVEVTLHSSDPMAQLHVTLDGSSPETGPLYEHPLTLTAPGEVGVRAVAVDPVGHRSPLRTAVITVLDPSAGRPPPDPDASIAPVQAAGDAGAPPPGGAPGLGVPPAPGPDAPAAGCSGAAGSPDRPPGLPFLAVIVLAAWAGCRRRRASWRFWGGLLP